MLSWLLIFTLQVSATQARVDCYAELLDVTPRWEIKAVLEPSDKNYAWVIAEPDYLRATIFFSPMFFGLPDVTQRQGIVHELVHILEWELGELAERTNMTWGLRLQEQLATTIERWDIWEGVCNG